MPLRGWIQFFQSMERMNKKTKCMLCPKGCELEDGQTGDCRVRKNIGGTIECTTYGHPCSLSLDPVEKKPLYHFLPGSTILSIGMDGCNLHCKQCQNWQISQCNTYSTMDIQPNELPDLVAKKGCSSIAYTYTEPLVSYEYVLDCCTKTFEAGFRNVLVTAAFINPDPLRKICNYVDAANVDLKSFSDAFYRDICDGRLKPVLNALKVMKECGVMIEITNLLIPTLNDTEDETKALCDWVVENLGVDTPLHFSRFYPQNLLTHLPPTPSETIVHARDISKKSGLRYIYVGNMEHKEGECTWCPNCGKAVISRKGYRVEENCLVEGACPDCKTLISGIWK